MKYLREDRVEALVLDELGQVDDPKGKTLAKLKTSLQIMRPQDISMYRQKMTSDLNGLITRMRIVEDRLYDDKLVGIVTQEKYDAKRRQFAEQTADILERIAMLDDSPEEVKPQLQLPHSENPIVDLYLKSAPHQKRVIMALTMKIKVNKKGMLRFKPII